MIDVCHGKRIKVFEHNKTWNLEALLPSLSNITAKLGQSLFKLFNTRLCSEPWSLHNTKHAQHSKINTLFKTLYINYITFMRQMKSIHSVLFCKMETNFFYNLNKIKKNRINGIDSLHEIFNCCIIIQFTNILQILFPIYI